MSDDSRLAPMRRRTFLAVGAAAASAGCGRTLRYADEFDGTPTETGTPTFEPGGSFWEGPLWLRAVNGRPDSTVEFAVTIERVSCGSRPTADGDRCSGGDGVYERTLAAQGLQTEGDGSYSGTSVSLHFDGDGGTVVPAAEIAAAENVVTEQGDYRVTVEADGQRAVEGVRAHAGVRGFETAISFDGELLLEAETDRASGAFSQPRTVTGSGTPGGDRDRPT